MSTMNGILEWVLGGLVAAGGAEPQAERAGPGGGAAIVSEGGRAARVGVADVGGARAWLVAPLLPSGDELREEGARVVSLASRFVDVPARVDALRRVDGRWALVQDVNRGGSRMLEMVELPAGLLDAGAPAADGLPMLASRRFLEVAMDGDSGAADDTEATGGAELFRDLFAPRLVELDGGLHVIASSKSIEGAAEPVTWIAPVPADGSVLAARRIGLGADARVAKLGGEWCCLVRALGPGDTLDDPAPVHVYWSGDLASWRPSLPLDEETRILDYDVIADLGALWLVATVPARPVTPDTMNVAAVTVRAWRLDARDAVWTPLPLELPLDGPAETHSVRLLPSSFGAPAPKLVLPPQDGRSRILPLPPR